MFRILRRRPPVEAAEAAASLWERFLPKPADIVTWLAVFLTSGAGMTYLASATDWLAAWGPVAWGAIGIAFGGAVLLVFALAGRVRARRAEPALEARIAALESKPKQVPSVAPGAPARPERSRSEPAPLEGRVAVVEEARTTLVEQLRPELAALREDVDRALDAIKHNAKAMREGDAAGFEKLRAAIHANAEAMREEGAARLEMIRKEAKHAIEQGQKREEAFNARLKNVADAAERRTKAVFDVVNDTFDPKFDGLDGKINEYVERLGDRLRGLEVRVAATEEHFHRLLRVRDAASELGRLRAELEPLAERLLRADRAEYPDAETWQTAYEMWHELTQTFWRVAARWGPPDCAPRVASPADLRGVKGVPEDERFADYGVQQSYRVLLVSHMRHGAAAGETMAQIEAEARGAPNPVAPPSPRPPP